MAISSLNSSSKLTGSINSKNSLNGKLDNGVYIPPETDPTVPSWVKNISQEDIDNWNEEVDLSGFYTKDEIDNKQYLTEIPSEYITETELDSKGYLTKHQDITHLATKEELADGLNTKADINHTHDEYLTQEDIQDINLDQYYTKDEIDNKEYLTEHQDISHLATKEDLENIDVDLTEYYTKTEIDNKGYITQKDINSISDEVIDEIVNFQITNANEVSY